MDDMTDRIDMTDYYMRCFQNKNYQPMPSGVVQRIEGAKYVGNSIAFFPKEFCIYENDGVWKFKDFTS